MTKGKPRAIYARELDDAQRASKRYRHPWMGAVERENLLCGEKYAAIVPL